MQKWLVGVAVAAIILAVGVVGAMTYFGGSGHTMKAPVAQVEPTPAPEDAVPAEPPAPAPAAKPKLAKASAKSDKKADVAADPAPAADAPKSDAAEKASKLLDSLSPEVQDELMRQMRDRQMARFREQRKYQLPSSWRIQALNFRGGRDPALKLNDAQQQQLAAVNELMKPKIEAALSDYWAKEEQLRQQMDAVQAAGRADEAEALRLQLRDTRTQMDAARNDLDKDYRQMLTSVLTPEQLKALDATPQFGDGNRGPGGGPAGGRGARRGGGGGQPSTGQPAAPVSPAAGG